MALQVTFFDLLTGEASGGLVMLKFLNILLWGAILLTTTSCGGWFRPVHLTPKDALTEYPGYLTNAKSYISSSVTILQQHPFENGLILLYRWQSPKSQQIDAYCMATTYITPKFSLKGYGWQAHSSTFFTVETKGRNIASNQASTYKKDCKIPADSFVAGYIVRGEKNKVTSISGFSSHGAAVQIIWSDGQIDSLPLASNASFFSMRQGELGVQSINLLDENNRILESKRW